MYLPRKRLWAREAQSAVQQTCAMHVRQPQGNGSVDCNVADANTRNPDEVLWKHLDVLNQDCCAVQALSYVTSSVLYITAGPACSFLQTTMTLQRQAAPCCVLYQLRTDDVLISLTKTFPSRVSSAMPSLLASPGWEEGTG
eukprot:1161215-Pelagomonas_calceolata.AAC.7